MTNYEKIMQEMTVRKLAAHLTCSEERTEPHESLPYTFYTNDAGSFYDYDQAIDEEVEWLNSEVAVQQ